MAKAIQRRRAGASPGALQLIMIGIIGLALLTTLKAFQEHGEKTAQGIAETMIAGAAAATAAAWAARFLLLRIGLVFLAPWVAGAVAVGAFAAVGAWKLSADSFGPGGSGSGSNNGSGTGDDDCTLRLYSEARGEWYCADPAG